MGAISAMTSFTWARTRAKSTEASPSCTIPKRAASRKDCRRFPAAIKALEGTQPTFRHSPPIALFSINTTDTPNEAPMDATDKPAEPAPMTQRSGFRTSSARSLPCLAIILDFRSSEAFYDNREQSQDPEPHERD